MEVLTGRLGRRAKGLTPIQPLAMLRRLGHESCTCSYVVPRSLPLQCMDGTPQLGTGG